MNSELVVNHIVSWLKDYAVSAGVKGYVVGVSGGIDSAVTSTLCALTKLPLVVVNMPIYQPKDQLTRGLEHLGWLRQNFDQVKDYSIDLSTTFGLLEKLYPEEIKDHLTMANTRARLRMTTLYAVAGGHGMLVAGTGNKVEDFGVGFFTKYGDGGVDVSPIADLMKTEVFQLAKYLNIIESIQTAKPTDGLWDDDRSDEDQLGATYSELEWAMEFNGEVSQCSIREKEVLAIYSKLNRANQHKMNPIPVCLVPKTLKFTSI